MVDQEMRKKIEHGLDFERSNIGSVFNSTKLDEVSMRLQIFYVTLKYVSTDRLK